MNPLFLFQGLLFIILGIPLALNKIKPNGVYGFRTSKTLSDPKIWYAVNRACGIDLIIAGLVIVAGSFLFNIILKNSAGPTITYANLALLVLALAAVIIHGYIIMNRF